MPDQHLASRALNCLWLSEGPTAVLIALTDSVSSSRTSPVFEADVEKWPVLLGTKEAPSLPQSWGVHCGTCTSCEQETAWGVTTSW